jgi:hypothetical protein
MDSGINQLFKGYSQTLAQLKEFFAKKAPVILKKGSIFLDYGDQSQKLGIVLEGLLYSSYVSENGQEWISNFFYPPNHAIISSHESFLLGKKSTAHIHYQVRIRCTNYSKSGIGTHGSSDC